MSITILSISFNYNNSIRLLYYSNTTNNIILSVLPFILQFNLKNAKQIYVSLVAMSIVLPNLIMDEGVKNTIDSQ